ncbi:MAG TPA: 2-C-methyl-D-erythritol 4-phosphate cytidylyltransferase [bacterium]
MSVYAVLVAAGQGKRFKAKKQFVLIDRKPLLTCSLDVFEKNNHIKSVIIVVQENDIARTRDIVRRFKYSKVHAIVPGGKRRQDSVRNGIMAIYLSANTDTTTADIAVVHDAVRPLISNALINQGIALCRKYHCVTPGVPVRDTIKYARTGRVIKTMPRENLFQIQTPQFFDLALLRTAYNAVKFSDEFTDEASIIEAYGAPVYVMPGSRTNIKVTDRADLDMVRRLITSR